MIDHGAVVEALLAARDRGSDDAHLEAKASVRELSKGVWESVSAFANTEGGLLVLGVAEEEGFAPAEGFSASRIVQQVITGMGDGGQPSRLENSPQYEIDRVIFEGREVVALQISPNGPGRRPCFIRDRGMASGAFKRRDDQDIRLSATEIYAMQMESVDSEADRIIVPDASVGDLDQDLVRKLIDRHHGKRVLTGVRTDDQALRRLNVLAAAGGVQLAGLLSVGIYPQQFYPRLFIDVTAHPGRTKADPGAAERFLDRVECDGNLLVAIEDAVKAVAKNLRTVSYVSGESTSRREELEIPRDVLREAIVNAVVHREYSSLFQGTPVTVDVYPDRVEISNPGGLWGGVTVENIDAGISRCRNKVLMQLLLNLPFENGLGPQAEGQGSGVPLIRNRMAQESLPRPEYSVSADRVTLILARHGAGLPDVSRWAEELVDRPLERVERAALAAVRTEGVVSVRALADKAAVDSREAEAVLSSLVREGVLHKRTTGEYDLSQGGRIPTRSELEILETLRGNGEMHIRELADALKKTPNTLRPKLRTLIEDNLIEATAPPQSRNRAYRVVE